MHDVLMNFMAGLTNIVFEPGYLALVCLAFRNVLILSALIIEVIAAPSLSVSPSLSPFPSLSNARQRVALAVLSCLPNYLRNYEHVVRSATAASQGQQSGDVVRLVVVVASEKLILKHISLSSLSMRPSHLSSPNSWLIQMTVKHCVYLLLICYNARMSSSLRRLKEFPYNDLSLLSSPPPPSAFASLAPNDSCKCIEIFVLL